MAIQYRLISKVNPIDRTAPFKYYAVAIHEKTFTLDDLAREVAQQSTTASEGDVYSVIIGLRDAIRKHLERSDKVVISGIGSFQVNLSSDGAESEKKFHPSLIKKAKILYQEDTSMKEFVNTLKYEKSAPRAVKNNSGGGDGGTIDLEA